MEKKRAAENYLFSMKQWDFKKQCETKIHPVSLLARQVLRVLYAQATK
jgi:hypothetical protein